jgi:hypothetical protein
MERQIRGEMADQEPHALPGLGIQHRRERRVERHVVTTGEYGRLRRVGGTPQEPQQRHVIDARAVRVVQPESLGCPQRQPAGAQAVLERLASTEICRQRQGDRQLRDAPAQGMLAHPTTVPDLAPGELGLSPRPSRLESLNRGLPVCSVPDA